MFSNAVHCHRVSSCPHSPHLLLDNGRGGLLLRDGLLLLRLLLLLGVFLRLLLDEGVQRPLNGVQSLVYRLRLLRQLQLALELLQSLLLGI